MKIWDLYNKLDDEQKTYLGSLVMIHEIEVGLKEHEEYKIEEKEDIFEAVHEAWIDDGSNYYGGGAIAGSIINAIVDKGLTINQLKDMRCDEILDIVEFGYEKDEDLEL